MMDNKFKKYMSDIGMSDVAINRAKAICDRYERVFSKSINDLIVTDIFDAANTRQYRSLWVTTEAALSEFKEFMVSDDVDFIPAIMTFSYVNFKYSSYDLVGGTDSSRLTVIFRAELLGGTLTAAGNNCDHLLRFAREHILNKLR